MVTSRLAKDLPQKIDPVAAALDALKSCEEIEKIILFGSRAIGDHWPRSDVDLAIVAPGADTAGWMAICDAAEEAETLIPIDLVRYEETSGAFRAAIDRHGKVIYERAAG
jgi:predicted nucleotidyltransferase